MMMKLEGGVTTIAPPSPNTTDAPYLSLLPMESPHREREKERERQRERERDSEREREKREREAHPTKRKREDRQT